MIDNDKTWLERAWERVACFPINYRWLTLILLWGLALISAFSREFADITSQPPIGTILFAALIMFPFFPLGVPALFYQDFDKTPDAYLWLWVIYIWICFIYIKATERRTIYLLLILAILLAANVGGCVTAQLPKVLRSGKL